MANRQRGQVDIEVNGKIYTLRLSTDAICQLEEALSADQGRDVTFQEVMEKVSSNSIRYARWLIWAAMRDNHSLMTLKGVGEWVDEAGGFQTLAAQLQKLTSSAVVDPEDAKELDLQKSRPQQAQTANAEGGTGARSKSRRGNAA
jgi:hypothetical protein